jgi:molybdate transport system substrate-binding protein
VTKGWAALGDPGIRHVAIPNPALAPYGVAAVAALKQAHRYNPGQLVMGESAARAAQFVQAGGAEVGVLPLSLAVSPRLGGRRWTVPANQHPPLLAEAVALTPAGEPFLAFATGKAAAAIWRRFGFEPR